MRKLMITVLGLLMVVSASAFAEERATTAEAQAMAEKAAEFVKANGVEKSKSVFEDQGGEWIDRDLYVFVMDLEGVMAVHGAKPVLVGKNLSNLKDASGFAFVKDGFLKVTDTGWVDYQWQNPTSNKIEPKTSYIINIGDHIVAVGAYK